MYFLKAPPGKESISKPELINNVGGGGAGSYCLSMSTTSELQ